jgi:hypothetical protein
MPILYIHGVNVRSRSGFFECKEYLERYIAPALSDDPDHVLIDDVYWGDVGVQFAWNGASRPLSRLLGMGPGRAQPPPLEELLTAAAYRDALKALPPAPAAGSATGGLISGGAAMGGVTVPPPRLRDLAPDALSDLLAEGFAETVPQPEQRARLALAADAVARDPATRTALAAAASAQQELDILLGRVRQRAEADAELVGMGTPPWLAKVRDRLDEALGRAVGLPTYAASVLAAELRKPLNELVSVFLGDVFAYLDQRGDAGTPGEISRRLLEKLRRAHANKRERGGEPLVVLSHSMGGQIVYDAVTHFLPADPALRDLRIDFWCAAASQVGFFEEAKLFLARDDAYQAGHPVPFPSAHLGVWCNVWDHNDVLSFTAKDIIAGVMDEPFDSGLSLLAAHGGYLRRPSFYRAFAEKLRAAAVQGWRTP